MYKETVKLDVKNILDVPQLIYYTHNPGQKQDPIFNVFSDAPPRNM